MNAGTLLRLRIVIILVALLMINLAPVNYEPAAKADAYDYSWTDDFDTTYLHPMWSWVREDVTHWSLTAAPGNLRIITQEGGIIEGGNNQNNLLIAEAPVGDFQISAKVTINPTENFQYAAIQVYQDDDNYIQLNWAYVGSGTTLNLDKEIGGVITNIQVPAPAAAALYLKIERQGNVYSGYYSTDGSAWTEMGEQTATLFNPKVSLAAANNLSGVAEIPADFDWFRLEAGLANFYYTHTDDFSSAALDSRWTWMNENPSAWSLTDRPGFMRILTDNGALGEQNLLYQAIPSGDFSISTHQFFTPTSNYQIASLVIYQDSDDFIQLGRAFCSGAPPDCTGGNGIYFDFVNEGFFIENFATSVPVVGEAYLKIERLGRIYSAYYSEDGADWRLIGRHKPGGPFAPTIIGLTAIQDFSSLEPPADFDFFEERHNMTTMLPLVMR